MKEKDEGESFCDEHICMVWGCKNPTIREKITKIDYVQRYRRSFRQSPQYDEVTRVTYGKVIGLCTDNVCKKCYNHVIPYKQDGRKTSYCILHNCNHPDCVNEIYDDYRSCILHLCSKVKCGQVKTTKDFCEVHSCQKTDDDGTICGKYNNKNVFSESHKCTNEGCTKEKYKVKQKCIECLGLLRDGGTVCSVTKCNNFIDVGGVSTLCSRHKCSEPECSYRKKFNGVCNKHKVKC